MASEHTLQPSSQTVAHVLAILTNVRNSLSNLLDLPMDYDIIENTQQQDALGYCDMQFSDWRIKGKELIASSVKINHIGITLRNEDGSLYDITTLLSILLHELAHVATAGEMRRNVYINGRRMRGWQYVHHSDTFYKQYARMLAVAEEQQIFILPPKPGKFSRKALERFDNIDVRHVPLGASTNLRLLESVVEESRQHEETSNAPRRFTIHDANRKVSKLVQLQECTLECLLASAKKMCKAKAVYTRHGARIASDAELQALLEGEDLTIVKSA